MIAELQRGQGDALPEGWLPSPLPPLSFGGFGGFGFCSSPVQVIGSKSWVGRKLIAVSLPVIGREVDQADRVFLSWRELLGERAGWARAGTPRWNVAGSTSVLSLVEQVERDRLAGEVGVRRGSRTVGVHEVRRGLLGRWAEVPALEGLLERRLLEPGHPDVERRRRSPGRGFQAHSRGLAQRQLRPWAVELHALHDRGRRARAGLASSSDAGQAPARRSGDAVRPRSAGRPGPSAAPGQHQASRSAGRDEAGRAPYASGHAGHCARHGQQPDATLGEVGADAWSSGIRSCVIESRSRTVTAWSSRVSKSTVTQYGVPISSWRR